MVLLAVGALFLSLAFLAVYSIVFRRRLPTIAELMERDWRLRVFFLGVFFVLFVVSTYVWWRLVPG